MGGKHLIMGQNELREMVLNESLCTGCGACIDLCPYFKSYKGTTTILFPCTLSQGRCFAHCPKIEVNLDDLSQKYFGRPYDDNPVGFYQTIMVSRAGEKIKRAAFQAVKKAISRGLDMTLQQGLELEHDYFSSLFNYKDPKEGARAFVEKRPPVFKGK